jgi:hypothetical protein
LKNGVSLCVFALGQPEKSSLHLLNQWLTGNSINGSGLQEESEAKANK